jgi:rare lipoprotein A
MSQRVFSALFAVFAVLCGVSGASARSGQAAYHYHSSQMITAARYEPIGSMLKVTNPENGRSVVVRVTGAGPYNGNRILDLSTGAFSKLFGSTRRGVGPIRYTVISRGSGRSPQRASSRRSSRRTKRSYRTRSSRRR